MMRDIEDPEIMERKKNVTFRGEEESRFRVSWEAYAQCHRDMRAVLAFAHAWMVPCVIILFILSMFTFNC